MDDVSWEFEGPVEFFKELAKNREIPNFKTTNGDILAKADPPPVQTQTSSSSPVITPSLPSGPAPPLPSDQQPKQLRSNPPIPPVPPPNHLPKNPPLPPVPPPTHHPSNPPLPSAPPPKQLPNNPPLPPVPPLTHLPNNPPLPPVPPLTHLPNNPPLPPVPPTAHLPNNPPLPPVAPPKHLPSNPPLPPIPPPKHIPSNLPHAPPLQHVVSNPALPALAKGPHSDQVSKFSPTENRGMVINQPYNSAPMPESFKPHPTAPFTLKSLQPPAPVSSRPPLGPPPPHDKTRPPRRPRGMSLSSSSRRSLDSYEKVCQVGGGTYGDVFKARDRETGEIVALKKVRLEDEKEGFPVTALREIKFLSQVDHRHIVKLKEVVTSKASDATRNKGSVYMVFEYAECDLVGLMKAVKLNESHIMSLLKQLLEALHFAHTNKVLHRDIKPSNVLVNSQGILKLADWGLCRRCSVGGKYTNRVVTRWYRAPELLLGEQQYTWAIDMWAVGCLMAELLTGRAILPGKDDVNQLKITLELCGTPAKDNLPSGWANLPLAKELLNGEPTPSQLQLRFAMLRPEARDLLLRMLELDPSKRITASEALDHDYFWGKNPAPCDPSQIPMPKGDGLHEFQLREMEASRMKQQQQQQQQHDAKRWKQTQMPPVKN